MQEQGAERTASNADDTKEHQAIAEQINEIRLELEKESPDTTSVFHSLRKLLEMTQSHFKHEEDRMLINGYPGMLLHKRDHDYLVKGLSEFTSSVVDETAKLSPEVGEELQSWLRFHIKRFDDAYSDYLGRENRAS
jgi:hemerythrin